MYYSGVGQEGGNPGVMGVGSVREEGEERGGETGYPKGRGLGEKDTEKKHTEAGTTKEGDGNRSKRYGKLEIQTPVPHTP